MRLITGADIVDFYDGSYDLLILADGEYTGADYDDFPASGTGDTRIGAYSVLTTVDGDEVQILLERSTISDGDWYPDALNADGLLDPKVADEMAHVINNDAGLHTTLAVRQAREVATEWENATAKADALALDRARAVRDVVTSCGGNQSMAARLLSLDQSTVNKLIRKAGVAR